MLGNDAAPGLIPRSMDLLFTRLRFMNEEGWKIDVTLEVLEIYNETLKDLLLPAPAGTRYRPQCSRTLMCMLPLLYVCS